jgi:Skp family chaperone for outer membrane proteins
MRNPQKFLSCLSSVLFAATVALPALSQTAAKITASPTVGVVDREKVVTSYPKAQSAADELRKDEDRVHKLIEDSNKQYEDAKNAHKPPAELEGLQKRLQASIDDEVKKVQGRAQGLESQLESDIDGAIKAEAATHHVDFVVMKQAVLLGGVDLTDGVIKRITALASTPAAPGKPATK